MIISQLNGGLGNQMFQYAIGRVISHHNSDNYFLDIDLLSNSQNQDTIREYALDVFPIKASIYSQSKNIVGRNLKRLLYSVRTVREKSFRFDPTIIDSRGSIILKGFWQSEQYFLSHRELILRDFVFPSRTSIKNQELLQDIEHSNSISIHVRRGDYATNPIINKFHGLCDLNYFEKAIELLKSKVKNPIFYVFSDDPDWCRQNLKVSNQTVYVSHNLAKNSWEDMRLMSSCQHHIIANSSFSWWGAWLDRNPEKIVIAPSKWFSDPKIDTRDVVPIGWVRI